MTALFVLVPLIGYAGLWILGGALFLVYFKLYNISIDLRHTVAMIQRVPAFLAIITVPVCSFISFFVTTRIMTHTFTTPANGIILLEVGVVSLIATIILDLLITVVGEKIDVRIFPVNLMYLFAWLVIGYRSQIMHAEEGRSSICPRDRVIEKRMSGNYSLQKVITA